MAVRLKDIARDLGVSLLTLSKLNQDISIGELQTDIEEIGYPRCAT